MVFLGTINTFAQTEQQADSIIKANSGDIYENPDKVIKVGANLYKNTNYSINLRVRSLMMVSDAYSSKRDYQKALKYFLKAYDLSKKSTDKKLQIGVLNKTAIKYQQLKVYDKAVQYLDEAEKLIREYPSIDSVRGALAVNYIVRGFIYKDQLNCDIAIGYFDRGVQEYLKDKRGGGESSLSIATYNKGNCYMLSAQYDLAKKNFLESIKYADVIHANSLKAFSLKGLGQVYTLEGNYKQSIVALNEALEISKSVGDLVLNKGIYSGLADNYLALNEWPNYHTYHKKYMQVQLELTESERKSISDSIDELSQVQELKLSQLKDDYIYKLITVAAMILFAVFFIYRYHKRAKKSLNSLTELIAKMKKEREIA
jgi:tetratricopeptide (TPR) repeat protein